MPFKIAESQYSPQNVLVIAELGTAHQGDPVKARELVDAAASAGADCIKVQIVYADEILHPNTGLVALPGGNIRLYNRFKALEVPPEFFADLRAYIESKGCLFLATPFGIRSARETRNLNPRVLKIASPELNYHALLREIAEYKLPVFLSTGVSTLGDLEESLAVLGGDVSACLLHCVTAYPAPVEEYNLKLIENLSRIFGLPVGVSDHSLDPELVPVLTVAMGGVAIEKHFCLSRNAPGLDDPIALPPEDFARMVRGVRWASKEKPETIIAEVSQDRGVYVTDSVLGDGIKRPAPSERANYGRTNRSIHAVRDIQPGESITEAMVAALRTEKVLRPGLPPAWQERIIGRTARSFIPAGEGIRFEDI
jgi:sialic acid synthase SpsE